MNSSPTSQISQLTSVNLSAIDTSALDTIIFTNIPNLKANLTALNTSLGTLYNLASNGTYNPGVLILTLSPSSAPYVNLNRDIAALNDFKLKMSSIITILNSLISTGGNLDMIQAQSISLKNSMKNVTDTANVIIVILNSY